MALMLEGFKVLDAATMLAGPLSATLLADFGADVIKVEQPVVGDPMRQLYPHKDGVPLWFKALNRNKRAVTLDLHKPEGQALFKELVKDVDVLVENFRPGTLERWNLGWEVLREINPHLIMLRTTGFGQTGPDKDKPGFGRVAEAFSGLAYINGFPDRAPVHAGLPLADSIAGVYGAFSIASALLNRGRDPERAGEFIDLGLYEAVFRLLDFSVIEYDQLEVVRERMGNANGYVAPVGTYRTKDGKWASVTASTPRIVDRLFQAIGQPELSQDPRFSTNGKRLENREQLDLIIGAWCETKMLEEIDAIFKEHEVTFALIYNIADIFDDAHYAARENIITVDDAELGPVRMQNVVPRFSRSEVGVRTSGPSVGQHNAEIFEEMLGLTRDETDKLRANGVI